MANFTKHISKFDIKRILELEKEGKNVLEISKILDIPNRRMSEMLKLHNIVLQGTGYRIKKNQDFFEKIDSEIKAYLLGYVLADGCVSIEPKRRNGIVYSYNKRLTLVSSINDREVINLFKEYIAKDALIKEYHNPRGAIVRKRQLQLRFSSVKLINDLIKLNIQPRKTYHIDFKFDFNNIPTELHRHFIRGFFDGDGSMCNSQFSLISTSSDFLDQIKEIIEKIVPLATNNKYEFVGKTVNWYKLYFFIGRNNQKQLLFDYLYKDSNFFLIRKKNKFNIENTVLTN